jgi:hypothetical protein
MSKLDVFHDATLCSLRFDTHSDRTAGQCPTDLQMEFRLIGGRPAEVSCLDVFGMNISGVTVGDQLLELGVRTHAQHVPEELGWIFHLDPANAAANEHCVRLAERVRSGELIEVMLAGAITLNGHLLCRGVEIRIDGAKLPLTAEDTSW